MLDITDTIAPKSDQANADDLLAGPRTFTIDKVTRGNDEQPINVHLVEFPGRPWRPSKTDRRVLVSAWGPDGDLYAGRRITLYRDETVKFGGQTVGGIRIRAMSHLPKRLTLSVTVTRGKKAPYVVEPLPDEAPREPGITQEQTAKLVALLQEQGHDRASSQAMMSALIGRQVAGSKELTKAEAAEVIAALEAEKPVTELPQTNEPDAPLWPDPAPVPQ